VVVWSGLRFGQSALLSISFGSGAKVESVWVFLLDAGCPGDAPDVKQPECRSVPRVKKFLRIIHETKHKSLIPAGLTAFAPAAIRQPGQQPVFAA
jgi:hypothetical protein